MLDQALSECLDRAISRLPHICRDAPAANAALLAWASRLSPTGRPRDYFDGGRAVMLVLPWWLEKRIRPTPDIAFQERLVESTVCAYYFVRLIDNVMDENGAQERRLLPVLGLLHSNFVREYTRLFPSDAPFWDHFNRYWAATAEAAIRDKILPRLSLDDFFNVAARKTSGIKIPLAAVCCRYDRTDLLEPWCDFHDRFACWLQMADDTFDWVHDLRNGDVTFFLSEAHRQKRNGESVSGWVIRRGFAWAINWLEEAMRDLYQHARRLESPELIRFLTYRDAEIRERWLDLSSKLKDVAMLVDVFEPISMESRLHDSSE
jgi:hypothetical protein